MQTLSAIADPLAPLYAPQVEQLITQTCPENDYRNKRVLIIVPDGTRTAPIGLVFKALFQALGGVTSALDVLVALGTHQPMSESAICRRLEITEAERLATYHAVHFLNHTWDKPATLQHVGTLSADEIHSLSRGLFSLEVRVEINRLLFDYDQVIIVGPVFPHEVVGFSGGNKYLFPGVAGPEILNFFHWLGAVITTPRIIGHKLTPVRKVIDRAARFVSVPKLCVALVVEPDGTLAGLFTGTPEAAWDRAADLSATRHVECKDHPFDTILSCAPVMYDEIWTAGKCMYKLEPVLADGGELIIYAPHVSRVSATHGQVLHEIGYHCRDYFLNQWDRFKRYPWGVLAHSAHVHGLGTFENDIEVPRARVTLATQIPRDTCQGLNLGYRDPRSIDIAEFADRESDGILLVPKAGEILFRLQNPPAWAAPA
jgi:lactate racemase